jgi:RHS repeat-associated protein
MFKKKFCSSSLGALLLFLPHVAFTFPDGPEINGLHPSDYYAALGQKVDLKADGFVDPVTGSVATSLPLTVPQGRAGIEPELTLTYAASNAPSWVGTGWTLGYAPIIRSTKSGVPSYTASDTFLRGDDKLVDIGGGEYRAKIEGAFDRYLFVDGRFEVTDRDGVKWVYGSTTASRALVPQNRTFAWYLDYVEDPLGNFMRLTYTKDQGTLYLSTIEYTGLADEGVPLEEPFAAISFQLESRPDPASSAQSGKAVALTKRLRNVSMTVRGQHVRDYLFTYNDALRSNLSSVQEVGADGVSTLPATTFSYTPPMGQWSETPFALPDELRFVEYEGDERERDMGVRMADLNGDALTDIIQYSRKEKYTYGPENPYGTVEDMNVVRNVYLNTGSGWEVSQEWADALPADAFLSVLQERWFLRCPHAYPTPPCEDPENLPPPEYQGTFSFSFGATFADVNGDILPDIIQSVDFGDHVSYHGNSDGIATVWVNTGSGWIEDAIAPPEPFAELVWFGKDFDTEVWDSGTLGLDRGVRLGDVNGDDLPDILRSFKDVNGVATSSVWVKKDADHGWALTPFTLPEVFTVEANGKPMDRQSTGTELVDVNGDGLSDLVHRLVNPEQGIDENRILLGTGQGWVLARGWTLPDDAVITEVTERYDGSFAGPRGLLIADVNGDHLPDLFKNFHEMHEDGNGVDVFKGLWLNRGGSFEEVNAAAVPDAAAITRSYDWDELVDFDVYWDGGTRVLDVDANGVPDLVRAMTDHELRSSRKTWMAEGARPDRLTKQENGIGGSVSIEVMPSSLLTQGNPSGYPDLPFVIDVVKRMTISNGDDWSSTTAYVFDSPYYDRATKEFRGFGNVQTTVENNPHATVTETTYWQGKTRDGEPEALKGKMKRKTISSNGNVYDVVEETTTVRPEYSGASATPLLDRRDTWNYDGSPTARRTAVTYTYDAFANLVEIVELGEVDAATGADLGEDSITHRTVLYPNETANILSKPAATFTLNHEQMFEQARWFLYDSSDQYNQSPTLGLLTKEVIWTDDAPTLTEPTFSLDEPSIEREYDVYGNRVRETDPENRAEQLTYDAPTHRFVEKKENALFATLWFTDERFGVPIRETSPNGGVMSQELDAFGRVAKVFGNPDVPGRFTEVRGYSFGESTTNRVTIRLFPSIDDPQEKYTRTIIVDGLGRVARFTEESNKGQDIVTLGDQLDVLGQAVRRFLPAFRPGQQDIIPDRLGYVDMRYDPLGRLTEQRMRDGARTTKVYDHWMVRESDEMEYMKERTNDAYGREIQLKEFHEGAEYISALTYDALGKKRSSTDAEGNTTTWVYDTAGRLLSVDRPDGGLVSRTHDRSGKVLTETDANGNVKTFIYDAIGRKTEMTVSPSGESVRWVYDENGDMGFLTTLENASATVHYDYFPSGRSMTTTHTIDGSSFVTRKEYDLLGRESVVTHPNQQVVEYTYGPQGLKTADLRGEERLLIENMEFDAAGNPSLISYGDHTTTVYERDPYRQFLTAIIGKHTKKGVVMYTEDMEYDAHGNMTRKYNDALRRLQTFTYDDLHRLVYTTDYANLEFPENTYQYSPTGNILEKDGVLYTYGEDAMNGGPHAVTTGWTEIETRNFEYDANGNMIRRGGDTLTYTYDNRLDTVTMANGSTVDYAYDGEGRPVKRVEIVEGQPHTTLYAGEWYSIRDGVPRVLIETGGVRIASFASDTGLEFFHNDLVNSTHYMTGAGGAFRERMEFDPFGRQLIHNGEGEDLRFMGAHFTDSAKIYDVGSRAYDPVLGRYMSVDQIEEDPYSFLANNPEVIAKDPLSSLLHKLESTRAYLRTLSLPITHWPEIRHLRR